VILVGHRPLSEHLIDDLRCEVKREECPEGFDQVQEDQLRSRSGNNTLSQRQQWEKVYMILFDVRAGEIPTPCKFPDGRCVTNLVC
jgi:hypothetical protein